MISDSILPASANQAKDCNKKKRANRSAKLKQCKMDARREQWLSQVKNKGVERFVVVGREGNGNGEELPLEKKLEVKARGGDETGEDRVEGNHESSDSETSPLNSPGSAVSSESDSNISGTNFTGTSVSSCASSGEMCSGTITEDEDEEKEEIVDESDGCVDDWEAVADALSDNEKKHAPNSDAPNENELSPLPGSLLMHSSFNGIEKGNSRGEVTKSQPLRALKFNRGKQAWKADDAHRPHGLPNLSKHRSFPIKSSRHLVHGTAGFASFNKTIPVSSACDCPICYEELDVTDASFFPCPCGFRMCLFCYKRICEDDGRCPGCRKHYKNKDPSEADNILEGSSSAMLVI